MNGVFPTEFPAFRPLLSVSLCRLSRASRRPFSFQPERVPTVFTLHFKPILFLRTRLEHQDTIPWSNSLVENYNESFQQPPAPDVNAVPGQATRPARPLRSREYVVISVDEKSQFALLIRLLRRSVQCDQA